MLKLDLGGVFNQMGIVAATANTEFPSWASTLVSVICGLVVASGGVLLYRVAASGERDRSRTSVSADRREFVDRLEMSFDDGAFGVLVVEVDGLHEITTIDGRDEAAEVLADLAEQISARVDSRDCVAQIDADEFGVICPGRDLAELLEIRSTLEREIDIADVVPVGLSVGVAASEAADRSCLDVLDRARQSVLERRSFTPELVVDEALTTLISRS